MITLDTTRADTIGPAANGVSTPAFNAVAARGKLFSRAYATVPETLPSHISMMTGLYPAGHGVHENGRFLSASHPTAAEKLKGAGYNTAAFVSAFVLAGRFGLSRGFDLYDDAAAAGPWNGLGRDNRSRAGASVQAERSAPIRVGALLRSARAVRAAGAIPEPVSRPAIPG